jgi:hypothetical protein
MGLKKRLEKLEKAFPSGCPGCEPQQISFHTVCVLPGGEKITEPPLPAPRPPCTCKRRRWPTGITRIIVHMIDTENQDNADYT